MSQVQEAARPRVEFHKGLQGDYTPAQWPGENISGLKPFGKNLLIKVDAFASVNEAGVHFIDEHVEKMTASSTTGCIFAMGAEAFRRYDDGLPWEGDRPEIGDRIYFERHAGQLVVGADGATYRVMDYRCIAGGIDKEFVERQIAEGKLEMTSGGVQ